MTLEKSKDWKFAKKKKVQNLIFRWSYHSELLFLPYADSSIDAKRVKTVDSKKRLPIVMFQISILILIFSSSFYSRTNKKCQEKFSIYSWFWKKKVSELTDIFTTCVWFHQFYSLFTRGKQCDQFFCIHYKFIKWKPNEDLFWSPMKKKWRIFEGSKVNKFCV